MSININHLLNQNMRLENPSGTFDRAGNVGLAPAIDTLGRFERSYGVVVLQGGERAPIHGYVFLKGNLTPAIGGRITYDGKQYRIMTLEDEILGNGGRNHWEVSVQLWNFKQ